MLADDLMQMLETLGRDLLGLRDCAILLIGFAGGPSGAAKSLVSIAAQPDGGVCQRRRDRFRVNLTKAAGL